MALDTSLPVSGVTYNGVALTMVGAPTGDYYTKTEVDNLLANKVSYVIQSAIPTDTTVLWIDTGNNLLKYYNGSAWQAIGAIYG